MKRYFQFSLHNTGYRRETIAGATTFLTMAYIIVVNPAILAAAGIPRGPSVTATIIASVIGTVLMALYAKRPFAVAPYMGENAFIAFTVVKGLGYPWQAALGAVFIAGIVFTLMTVFRVRSWLADAIPQSLKYSFAAGIGLFITFVGLNETGLVAAGIPGAPVKLGNLSQPSVLLAAAGLLLTIILMTRGIRGALIIGIMCTTAASVAAGLTPLPDALISLPPDPSPIFMKLDVAGALQVEMLPVVLTIFIMSFVDTVGTLLGLSYRAGLLNADGNLPEIERPMLADALATTAAPLLGTSTTGAFIESAAGIAEGGRTGFSSLVTAFLFLLALFFAPIFTAVPPHAYGIALIAIGTLMLAPITKINFDDNTEVVPAFLTVALMSFTYNIGVGITAGLLTYPVFKTASGRHSELSLGTWVLGIISLVFFIFYARL